MKTGATTTSLWGSQDILFLWKNTPALCTNKEHKREERFLFWLTDTVSYRQPGRILCEVRDPSSFLGTQVSADSTSLSPLYPAPEKAVLLPRPWQMLSSFKDFFSLPCFIFSILFFSFKPPHHPLLLKKIAERERSVSHSAIRSCYFSLKADCPLQLTVIPSSIGNG